jgi:hypothetical protein
VIFRKTTGTVQVSRSLKIVDMDSDTITNATIRIAGGEATDVLNAVIWSHMKLVQSWDKATQTLSISGVATRDLYEITLQSITFDSESAAPTPSLRTITFTVMGVGTPGSVVADADVATGHRSAPMEVYVAVAASTIAPTPAPIATPQIRAKLQLADVCFDNCSNTFEAKIEMQMQKNGTSTRFAASACEWYAAFLDQNNSVKSGAGAGPGQNTCSTTCPTTVSLLAQNQCLSRGCRSLLDCGIRPASDSSAAGGASVDGGTAAAPVKYVTKQVPMPSVSTTMKVSMQGQTEQQMAQRLSDDPNMRQSMEGGVAKALGLHPRNVTIVSIGTTQVLRRRRRRRMVGLVTGSGSTASSNENDDGHNGGDSYGGDDSNGGATGRTSNDNTHVSITSSRSSSEHTRDSRALQASDAVDVKFEIATADAREATVKKAEALVQQKKTEFTTFVQVSSASSL